MAGDLSERSGIPAPTSAILQNTLVICLVDTRFLEARRKSLYGGLFNINDIGYIGRLGFGFHFLWAKPKSFDSIRSNYRNLDGVCSYREIRYARFDGPACGDRIIRLSIPA
jgi:hypothetical protein